MLRALEAPPSSSWSVPGGGHIADVQCPGSVLPASELGMNEGIQDDQTRFSYLLFVSWESPSECQQLESGYESVLAGGISCKTWVPGV